MSRLPSIAARNVRRNRRRTSVTLLAILVGVAMLMMLRGFNYGVIQLLLEDVVQGRTGAMQIHRAGYLEDIESSPTHLRMPYTPELIARIEAVPGVLGVAGRIQFGGLIGNGARQTMVVARGIDVAREKLACPRTGGEVKPGGEALSEGDRGLAVVGYELGQSLELLTTSQKRAAPGSEEVDFVTLQTSSPEGRANAMDFRVKGLSASALPFENKRVVTLPLDAAQELLGVEGEVTEYVVGVRRLDELETVADRLRAALGPAYEVHTWNQLQPFVRDVIVRQQIVLAGIGVVLFLIVLTGIVNTMLMSVFERVREIGTMLAVGVRRRQVMGLFVLEAAVLGVLGGLGGALLGRSALWLLAIRGISIELAGTSGKSLLRPSVTLQFTLLAVGVSIAVALLASLYPAWKASRLNPVDALRST